MDSQHSGEARPRRELPPGYHLAHFREMLKAIERLYAPILAEPEQDWLARFRALPTPAQSLYVRLVNRKGRVFRRDHLRYPDVADIDGALELLTGAGFAGPLEPRHLADALAVLTKDALRERLERAGCAHLAGRSQKKARLIDHALALGDPDSLFPDRAGFVVRRRRRPLRYLMFLHFGRIEDSLTRYALRDLGLMRTRDESSAFEPRFGTAADARAGFFYADALAQLDELDLLEIAGLGQNWPVTDDPVCTALRDRLAHEAGRRLERAGEIAAARRLYACGQSAECNERTLRLDYAAGERESVRVRLEAMIDAPASDSEVLFAQDFLARKFGGKRTSPVTDMLRGAAALTLDESWRGAPEAGAASLYRRQGWTVRHAENTPWRSLFGLLFWDELFSEGGGALHDEFERIPPVLKAGAFYEARREAIEAHLSALADREATARALLRRVATNWGQPNGIFRWQGEIYECLAPLLEFAPTEALATVLRAMARDYPERKDGFPDLLLTRDDRLRLIEIKSEGDQIRRNQLAQLDLLGRAGFDVAVNRVEWSVDPEQTYVVVDVETTGGRAERHRITEIGAVKVRDGEIVDSWETLVNPQRPIPAMITRLTGIDDAMVADAPVFADIADAFEGFFGDAVFVAHNVRFDHGFIAAEFARLDRHFRAPQICTCKGMRRHYKGLASYSLANLSAEFGIGLDSHHRALCDAQAAAELLLLINARRAEAARPAAATESGLAIASASP